MFLPLNKLSPLWDALLIVLAICVGFVFGVPFEAGEAEEIALSRLFEAPTAESEASSDRQGDSRENLESISELLEQKRWGEARIRCANSESDECENIHLRLMRKGKGSGDFDSITHVAKWLRDRGDSFGQRAGSISFEPRETPEVLNYCATARLIDDNACDGLEATLAAGLLTIGDAQSIAEGYRQLVEKGLEPPSRRGRVFLEQATTSAKYRWYGRAIRACEHGLSHGERRCAAQIRKWKRVLEE